MVCSLWRRRSTVLYIWLLERIWVRLPNPLDTIKHLQVYRVYQEYYQTHQLKYASPSAIAWIGSIQNFFLMSAGLFSGPLFDKHGAIVRPS
jgi:hypothetical protein